MQTILNHKRVLIPFVFLGMLLGSTSCTRPTKNNEGEPDSIKSPIPTTFNFYVENSGSMKGYFNGNSQIKDIIKEYYDRISESLHEGDTITLNYINTKIENSSKNIKDYLLESQNKCTAAFTKIDDIMAMAMEGLNDSIVNIVISDYCFASDNGSLPMAQSGITKLFSERLNTDTDLSIAIIKYMSKFNGKYYPGGIPNTKPLPFYLWIFGNEKQVKRIVNLPIKTDNCGTLILQPLQTVLPIIRAKKARMVNRNSIIVKEWNKDRNRSVGLFEGCSPTENSASYSVNIELDLSNVIISEKDICNINNYQITDGYSIDTITKIERDIYDFKITTEHPSPGKLSIVYLQQEMPTWIDKSNYIGTGVPKDSTTLGVKYLIEGAFDAYKNKSEIIFKTEIILK